MNISAERFNNVTNVTVYACLMIISNFCSYASISEVLF